MINTTQNNQQRYSKKTVSKITHNIHVVKSWSAVIGNTDIKNALIHATNIPETKHLK